MAVAMHKTHARRSLNRACSHLRGTLFYEWTYKYQISYLVYVCAYIFFLKHLQRMALALAVTVTMAAAMLAGAKEMAVHPLLSFKPTPRRNTHRQPAVSSLHLEASTRMARAKGKGNTNTAGSPPVGYAGFVARLMMHKIRFDFLLFETATICTPNNKLVHDK